MLKRSMLWTSVLAALLIAAGSARAQSSRQDGNAYQWSAELVSVDSTTSTVTAKARIAYPEAASDVKQFKPGEKVWIVWSGIHDYSDAVRQVRHAPAGAKIDDDLVMPAELVSTETPNQYLTIRVKAPAGSLAAIKSVKPGEWITVTSRHRPSTDAEAVVAMKPFVATAD